ncbi:hypothetical protein FNF27_06136 [Cafeteria roenbergensis]|uniref:Uncharacterized protein n=1 Tax=Cafeteria roenbergensis TaxID=33653 RepID=A0A5A8E890_CAFRO|nr:hypothetical protein FNF27_06136 [Cafeteria roenbergensis]
MALGVGSAVATHDGSITGDIRWIGALPELGPGDWAAIESAEPPRLPRTKRTQYTALFDGDYAGSRLFRPRAGHVAHLVPTSDTVALLASPTTRRPADRARASHFLAHQPPEHAPCPW